MGEYATKTTDEDGNTKWKATDGKTYSTRSGAWKWSKRLEKEKGVVGYPANPIYVLVTVSHRLRLLVLQDGSLVTSQKVVSAPVAHS